MNDTNQSKGEIGDKHSFIRCKFHHIPLILFQITPEYWRCSMCTEEDEWNRMIEEAEIKEMQST